MKRIRDSVGSTASILAVTSLLFLVQSARANLITNGSFEAVTPALSTNQICSSPGSGYPYSTCTSADWSGKYQIGDGTTIGIGGSSFHIPQPDPDGSNALILQSAGAYASQSVDVLSAGSYSLTFYIANRSNSPYNGPQTLNVMLDGASLGTYDDVPYSWTLESLPVDLTAGEHTLEFMTEVSGDRTTFVDDVSLATPSSAVPEPGTLALVGLTSCLAGSRLKTKNKGS